MSSQRKKESRTNAIPFFLCFIILVEKDLLSQPLFISTQYVEAFRIHASTFIPNLK